MGEKKRDLVVGEIYSEEELRDIFPEGTVFIGLDEEEDGEDEGGEDEEKVFTIQVELRHVLQIKGKDNGLGYGYPHFDVLREAIDQTLRDLREGRLDVDESEERQMKAYPLDYTCWVD